MKYVMVLVGAHNGVKSRSNVERAAALGPVLLVEPAPRLFEALSQMHGGNPAITLVQAAITETDQDEVAFFAPTAEANRVAPYGDQLGSLDPGHAAAHDPAFAGVVEKLTTRGLSFDTLLSTYDIDAIDTLVTDAEGYDARLLATFPFEKLRPRQILFEFKHSDGTYHMGRRLAALLVRLEDLGYRNRVMNNENCLATLTA
jgi:FkbM family methyltransferase